MRRRNLSQRTIGATAIVATSLAVVLFAVAVTDPPSVTRAKSQPPPLRQMAPVPRQGIAPEPAEGYESRWLARRARASRRCRQDPGVMTWPQAVTCALTSAFPEAAPWTDPASAGGWISAAAAMVEADLAGSVQQSFGAPKANGWQAMLWIRGPREVERCRATMTDPREIQACVAQALYPGSQWPPGPDAAPWRAEFWDATRDLIRGART